MPLHFKGLNALRFFSALSIIIYHCYFNVPHPYPVLNRLMHNLVLGVDMFFIISGFLIIYLLLDEKEQYGKISLTKFYTRRVLRIFPLYYLVIIIAFIFYYSQQVNFTPFLLFYGNLWMAHTGHWTADVLNPLWSLNIEEQFYLVIPLLLFYIPI